MAQLIRYVKIGFILGLKLVLKLGWHFKKITLKITTRIQHLITIRRFETHIMNNKNNIFRLILTAILVSYS